jgi:hypothetical protein
MYGYQGFVNTLSFGCIKILLVFVCIGITFKVRVRSIKSSS